jgi:hypothetical protein
MKYNSITTLIKGREFVIRSNCCDIETLKPEDIIFLDHDEEYDENNCKCQISFLDGKQPLCYDDLKNKYIELMELEPYRLLRIQRDKLLKETDYLMNPDYPMTEEKKNKVKEYRQYLRDLPKTQKPKLLDTGELDYNSFDLPKINI